MNRTDDSAREIDSTTLEIWLEERAGKKRDFVLVDVREPYEYEAEHIVGVDLLLPTSRYDEWGPYLVERFGERTVVLTCRTANRTGQLQPLLEQRGAQRIVNHLGGIVSYNGSKASGMEGVEHV